MAVELFSINMIIRRYPAAAAAVALFSAGEAAALKPVHPVVVVAPGAYGALPVGTVAPYVTKAFVAMGASEVVKRIENLAGLGKLDEDEELVVWSMALGQDSSFGTDELAIAGLRKDLRISCHQTAL